MTIPFRNLTPMTSVRDVEASIAFYRTLGFDAGNTVGEPVPNWAWLYGGNAQLMLAKATGTVVGAEQAVLFYLYVDDVAAKHAELAAAGIAVGEVTYPFYNPRGEFRVVDPDGYVLMITHT